jgi:tRNA A37 threonylcarbamoyladenosine modification protein TsaB
MYLFFNGVSSHWYIALLDEDKNIIVSETFHIEWNESTKTIPIIDMFLESQKLEYSAIQNIICVVGPWSFTWIRTISLVVNTLAYTYKHIKLTPVNFFDLYSDYPIVKSSSKRDLFVKRSKSAIIEVMSNSDFEEKMEGTKIFWDTDIGRFEKEIHISHDIDYETLLKTIALQDTTRIAPLYIKKPNIS